MVYKISKTDKEFATYVQDVIKGGTSFKDGSYKRFGKTYVKKKDGVITGEMEGKCFLTIITKTESGTAAEYEYSLISTVDSKRIEATQSVLGLKTLSDMGIDCRELNLDVAMMKTRSGKVVTLYSNTTYTQNHLENIYLT